METLKPSRCKVADSAIGRLPLLHVPESACGDAALHLIPDASTDATENHRRQGLISEEQCHPKPSDPSSNQHSSSLEGSEVVHPLCAPIPMSTLIKGKSRRKAPTFLEILTGVVKTGQSSKIENHIVETPAEMKENTSLHINNPVGHVGSNPATCEFTKSSGKRSTSRAMSSMSGSNEGLAGREQVESLEKSAVAKTTETAVASVFCTRINSKVPEHCKSIWKPAVTDVAVSASAQVPADATYKCDSRTTPCLTADNVAEVIHKMQCIVPMSVAHSLGTCMNQSGEQISCL